MGPDDVGPDVRDSLWVVMMAIELGLRVDRADSRGPDGTAPVGGSLRPTPAERGF